MRHPRRVIACVLAVLTFVGLACTSQTTEPQQAARLCLIRHPEADIRTNNDSQLVVRVSGLRCGGTDTLRSNTAMHENDLSYVYIATSPIVTNADTFRKSFVRSNALTCHGYLQGRTIWFVKRWALGTAFYVSDCDAPS